ncbi:MAG: serine/threonine-protein kinase [Polyangiaceae bacterium]
MDAPRPGSKKPPIPAASFTPPPVPSDRGEPAHDDDPLIGAVLLDRVRIVRAIARGGMGKVYLGEQTRLNRRCAVKVLDPRLVAGDDAAEFTGRFLLEASIAAKLTHPNAVAIFDYGDTPEGSCFIAMEYLEGRSLSDELRALGRLSPERTIHVALQVGRALREAHEAGAVHRDMKPGNVFLIRRDDDDDFVKVLDFGLVKETRADGGTDPAPSAQIVGSPRYMAPEQVQGKTVDARTDVYALGAMMYAMLTGRPPFERATELATMMAQVSDAPPAFATAAPDVPLSRGLEEVVMKCLSKNPDHRFASMAALVLALKAEAATAAVDSGHLTPALVEPVISSRTFAVQLDPRETPKRRGIAAAVVVGLGVVLAATAIGRAVLSQRASGSVPGVAISPAPQVAAVVPQPSASTPRLTATLHVETTPDGARVKEEGDTVCDATPCDIAYVGASASSGFEHLLVFMKADHKVERKLVSVDASPVRVKLTKVR